MRNIVRGQQVDTDRMRHAKALRRVMTREERILWERLRANRLDGLHFRRQQIIGRYIVDFYCHAAGVVVEVDGGIHRRQVVQDQARDAFLAAHLLCVLRFQNAEVAERLPHVLTRIAETCRARLAHFADAAEDGRMDGTDADIR